MCHCSMGQDGCVKVATRDTVRIWKGVQGVAWLKKYVWGCAGCKKDATGVRENACRGAQMMLVGWGGYT